MCGGQEEVAESTHRVQLAIGQFLNLWPFEHWFFSRRLILPRMDLTSDRRPTAHLSETRGMDGWSGRRTRRRRGKGRVVRYRGVFPRGRASGSRRDGSSSVGFTIKRW